MTFVFGKAVVSRKEQKKLATLFFYPSNYHKMRKISLLLLLAAIGCSKPSNPTTPSTPPGGSTAKFVPNWNGNDTLYGIVLDAYNNATGELDTIFTKNVNDTSFIVYHGKQYYIWAEPLHVADTFKHNMQTYPNIVISPDLNINNAISKSPMNGAHPHKYTDATGAVGYQKQALMVNDYSKFKKVMTSMYMSRTQK